MTYNFVGGISADSTAFSDLVDWHEVESHAPDFLAQSRTSRSCEPVASRSRS